MKIDVRTEKTIKIIQFAIFLKTFHVAGAETVSRYGSGSDSTK
jgi:hypothetical protein